LSTDRELLIAEPPEAVQNYRDGRKWTAIDVAGDKNDRDRRLDSASVDWPPAIVINSSYR
jgi:hypothetical protein